MDKLTKKEITRLTNESIASVRLALSAAVQAGAEARAMGEYVRAIDNLEDALFYFGDDEDDDDHEESTPDSPQPDLSAKEFENLRKAAVEQISRIHVGLLRK